jgi:hypothetical protein
MPDSTIAIDEGVGAKLDHYQRTITSNTVNQARVVLAEAYAASYSVSVTTAVATATANSHLLQIVAGALNRVILRRLVVYQMVAAGAATAVNLTLVRLTTAGTGGTSFTARALDPIDTATAAAAMTLPSSKGTEGNILWTGAMNVAASAGVQQPLLDLNWDDPRTRPPVIAAGTSNGLALKNITALATATVHIYAEFVELYYS